MGADGSVRTVDRVPIASHRFMAGVLLVVLATGCADEHAARPRPVEEASATTVASTTSVPTPPPTKPLVTAPPSPLLDEVVAAYDAAYADLLAAGAAPEEDHSDLGTHIADPQLGAIRDLLAELSRDGIVGRLDETRPPWRRIERFDLVDERTVRLEVCRFDPTEGVDRSGVVVDPATRPFRHADTMRQEEGAWKWTEREWLDDSGSSSDCASQ